MHTGTPTWAACTGQRGSESERGGPGRVGAGGGQRRRRRNVWHQCGDMVAWMAPAKSPNVNYSPALFPAHASAAATRRRSLAALAFPGFQPPWRYCFSLRLAVQRRHEIPQLGTHVASLQSELRRRRGNCCSVGKLKQYQGIGTLNAAPTSRATQRGGSGGGRRSGRWGGTAGGRAETMVQVGRKCDYLIQVLGGSNKAVQALNLAGRLACTRRSTRRQRRLPPAAAAAAGAGGLPATPLCPAPARPPAPPPRIRSRRCMPQGLPQAPAPRPC